MIPERKTVLALIEAHQGKQDFKIEHDVTDMTSSDLLDVFVNMMRYQTYSEIAIWRALVEKADEMVDMFEIVTTTKEWQNEKNENDHDTGF